MPEKSKPKSKPVQSKNWLFTDYKSKRFGEIYEEYSDIISYICVGQEVCPTTNRPHQQGWVQFKRKRRFNGVLRVLGQMNIESCRGTPDQNSKYCKKEGNWEEFGAYSKQGARTDLEHIKKMLDDGDTMKEVADCHFGSFLRYNQGMFKYRQLVLEEETRARRELEVTLITGPTGIGKTTMAVGKNDSDTYLIDGCDLRWWDGYEGQRRLVIDEYNNNVPIETLLKLLDGQQKRLAIKGGFTYAAWTTVYITTNLHDVELHSNAKPAHRAALDRRITTVIDLWDKSDDTLYPKECADVDGPK